MKHPVESVSDVKIKVIIKRIDHIDTEKQAFFADLWVGAWDLDDLKPSFAEYFQNHHHTLNSQDPGKKNMFTGSQPKWTITFQNVQDLVHLYKIKQLPEAREVDGRHLMRYHVQGTFSSVFDLRWFPFDRQVLKMKISLDIASKIARFGKVEVPKDDTFFDILSNSEWISVGLPEQETEERNASACGSGAGLSYDAVTVIQKIKRNPSHFVMTAFFPLIIIMACSFLMIHPGAILDLMLGRSDGKLEMDKLSYLSTMLLSVIALRFSFVDKMPRIPYLSLFDVVFMTSYWILFNMMCVAAEQRIGVLCSLSFFPFLVYQYMKASDRKLWKEKFGWKSP